MKNIQSVLTIAGVAVLIAFLGSVVLLHNASYHTDLRGAAFGTLAAAAWLDIIWVVLAIVLATTRWHATTGLFRMILLLNLAVVCLLAANFFYSH